MTPNQTSHVVQVETNNPVELITTILEINQNNINN